MEHPPGHCSTLPSKYQTFQIFGISAVYPYAEGGATEAYCSRAVCHYAEGGATDYVEGGATEAY